ncbi:addiction module protein [Stutzerimonas stutzeri]|uniref:addiction module protein n=1 Tax=Stutzerimonas stutzeri TaxID=316 RepID=UPI00163ADFBF|nr:addiction module protein [Stutzerimonas stutzeri]
MRFASCVIVITCSLAQPDNAPPLSAQQQQEVQRRLDAYREKPDDVQSWETIRSRLWSRLG